MEIAHWHYSCCVCLPGCKNARDTLLLLLYFQQLLTFHCNLFLFYPLLLKNNNNSTVLIINQQLWRPKDLLAEDCFCQERVPKLSTHGCLAEHIPSFSHTFFVQYPFLSNAGAQLSATSKPVPFQPVCGAFFDGLLLHFYLSEALKTPTSHKVFLTFMAFRSWVSKNCWRLCWLSPKTYF